MQQGSQTKVMYDTQYLNMLDSQLQFPGRYYMDYAPNKLETMPFSAACSAYAGGCRQFNVNSTAVNKYERVIPGKEGWTRNYRSASTEIVGGPFKARGDGPLMYTDALSQLWTPAGGYAPHCAKRLSEVTYDRFACVNAANNSEDVFDLRGGINTRQGVQYTERC